MRNNKGEAKRKQIETAAPESHDNPRSTTQKNGDRPCRTQAQSSGYRNPAVDGHELRTLFANIRSNTMTTEIEILETRENPSVLWM
jgi:hypothetical protein